MSGDFSKSGAVIPKGGGGLADGLVALRKVQRQKTKMANAGMQDSSEELRIDGDSRQSHIAQASSGNANPINKENIPGYYYKIEKGMTPEQIVAEYQSGLTTSGTSIFDPVLCELTYKWFCPSAGAILDPFAGGSVRGIVAAYLGYQYTGIDLRLEQVAANEEQARQIVPLNHPRWIVGDGKDARTLAPGNYDLIFSCPPYGDLEVYSDDPADLSTMSHEVFIASYRSIIAACVEMLKPNRFACFVVGDFRDKKGYYRNFVSDTISAFQDAGMTLYNEAILVTAVGSLPIRIGKQFGSYRKLGKTHQQVLVFYRGDIKVIPQEFGEIEVTDIASEFGEVVP